MLPRRLERLPRFAVTGDSVIHQANTLGSRLLGLAFLRSLPSGHALLIADCRSVHTFGMRFPIDVAFLDDDGRAIRLERAVGARRVRVCRGAFAVIESPAGEIGRYVGKEMEAPVSKRSRDR
jgi:uncharacterized membrane protein (UPF0127 family)